MKKHVNRLSELKKIAPFVKQYSEGVGKNVDQPLVPDRTRAGENLWLGNAVVAAVMDNGIVHHKRSYTYCTGNFFSHVVAGERGKGKPILIQIQDRPDDLSEEAFWGYIEWVVSKSPWSECFISKNINTIAKRRVAVIDGSYPLWYKKEATIAIRMAWENYYNSYKYREVDLWWDLYQKVDGRLAYIAGKLMAKDEGNGKIIRRINEGGHAPINLTVGSNKHINGWSRIVRTRGNNAWSSAGKDDITVIVKGMMDSIGADKVRVNPFGNNLTKKWDKGEFVEEMSKKLPALEGFINA